MSKPASAFTLIIACAFASLVHAQTAPSAAAPATSAPRVVRVDGVFDPADGLAPSAVEVVTLAVYPSPSDDSPLWQEVQSIAVGAGGRYAVFLGSTATDGLPVSLFASGEPRWLGIRFDRSGEAEQARVLLTSVPYAIRAADADTLAGLPPSAFLRADAAPGDAAVRSGEAGRTASRGDGPLVNTGTANYIGKFTNAIDLTSSVMFENGNRIGIGTTTPLDFVHARFNDNTGTVTGLAVQNLGSTAASYSGMLFYDQNGSLAQFQGFNNATHEYRINNIASGGSINFMLGSISKFRVRSDGDVDFGGNIRRSGLLFLHDLGGLSVALGSDALANGASSSQNVAVGAGALNTSTGSTNTALGWAAGANKTSGNYNIYIGAGVGFGTGNEANTTRIGDNTNSLRFFAGGIRGITTGLANAVGVMIDSNGQLGTVSSSRRYKQDIEDMGEASSGLMRLRPVTYRYRQAYADGSMPVDYGLIAEEVEQVYPDLVTHLDTGEVETVQYHKINAMLLNEVQKQQRLIEALAARLSALERLTSSAVK